ncbi:MmcQ/YjbR family DNA-binding protein [Dawidia soli]|uniref:MmcQ/YjbR family DNA-binding protein n=1 Tax=Dawidia soli TaxID=2782352 RepID=A0AAP2DEM1_9BACT|nr:MmcQ/YjbR family DNA-binding protein [Dawidia soli]MBT1690294.1 MmcQ/YjbR family DNA-binding protein [Dawidia soli]
MVTFDYFREVSLSFPEVTEEPHFEKVSFRVRKKIFATYDAAENRASMKLSEMDQDIFSKADKAAIYPVQNKWGKQGWTLVELKKVKKKLFQQALLTAYCAVAPPKLVEQLHGE